MIDVLEDTATNPATGMDALIASRCGQQANRVIELSPNTPDEAAQVLASITAAEQPWRTFSRQTCRPMHARQAADAGGTGHRKNGCSLIAARLATQLDVLELQNKIQSQVKENIDKSQRRYYLQEQMKAIRKELGEGEGGNGGGSEIDQLQDQAGGGQAALRSVMKESHPRTGPA